jgi:hypothetical protein
VEIAIENTENIAPESSDERGQSSNAAGEIAGYNPLKGELKMRLTLFLNLLGFAQLKLMFSRR